jgi:hypothetical protein
VGVFCGDKAEERGGEVAEGELFSEIGGAAELAAN